MGLSAVEPKVYPKPLKSSGSLDSCKRIDVTPVIGIEFPAVNLVEWMNASKADEILLDLAIKSGVRQAEQYTKLTASSFRAWRCLLSRPRRPHKKYPEAADVTAGRTDWKAKDLWPPYTSHCEL